MSNISLIQPQRVDFDTSQIFDWLDGLPMIGTPVLGGTLAGQVNAGNGGITVASVGSTTPYGAYIATVTAIVAGQSLVSVVDPSGIPIAFGVVGLPMTASGIAITLTQGVTAFTPGDSFSISVTRAPVDLTGLQFDLDARDTIAASSVALRASSADSIPTIVNGNATGTISMAVPRAVMAECAVKLSGYPYVISATDPVTGLKVPAYTGLIHHAASAASIGQA